MGKIPTTANTWQGKTHMAMYLRTKCDVCIQNLGELQINKEWVINGRETAA